MDARELLQDMMLDEGQEENGLYEGEEEPEIQEDSSSRRKRRGGIAAKSYSDNGQKEVSLNLEENYGEEINDQEEDDVEYAMQYMGSG